MTENLPKRYSARVNISDRKSLQHIQDRRKIRTLDEAANVVLDENLDTPNPAAFIRKGEEVVTVAFFLYPSVAERVAKAQNISGATFAHILRGCIRNAMKEPV